MYAIEHHYYSRTVMSITQSIHLFAAAKPVNFGFSAQTDPMRIPIKPPISVQLPEHCFAVELSLGAKFANNLGKMY